MNIESIITVACAVGSWVVAGWVTVNVVKAKMEDMLRRIETNEDDYRQLSREFNEFRLTITRDMNNANRGRGD